MDKTFTTFSRIGRAAGFGGAALVLCASAGLASAAGASADIEARYQSERAMCMDGKSNQDKATCLKEADAARAAAKDGKLDVADERYKRNAKARCAVLTGDEARDCLARMNGQGTTSGSARDGGIIRETKTITVGPAVVVTPAPTKAASAP